MNKRECQQNQLRSWGKSKHSVKRKHDDNDRKQFTTKPPGAKKHGSSGGQPYTNEGRKALASLIKVQKATRHDSSDGGMKKVQAWDCGP